MLDGPPIGFYPSPQLMVQYCTYHLGIVRKVGDPEGRGRVQVEVPGLLGEGQENWTDWIEVLGPPIGGTQHQGDEGIWWPIQPGQIVAVAFMSGDPFALYCVPGPPVQERDSKKEEQEKGKESKPKQWVPKEAKRAWRQDPREPVRLRLIKSEAGHTLLFDDRGEKEKAYLVDWTGSGLFWYCPGKDKDERENSQEQSKPRKGKRREQRLVVTGTAEKPSTLMKSGRHAIACLDLIGQGILQECGDDGGTIQFATRDKDGKIGPSIVLDAKQNRIYLTAGAVQIQVRGDKGDIVVTRQEVVQSTKVPVEDAIQKLYDELKEAYKEMSEE